MAYGDFKDLIRRIASDKILCDKAFDIGKNPKYDGCQRGLSSVVYKFFVKKSSARYANRFASSGIEHKNISNQVLAEELQKPIIEMNFQKLIKKTNKSRLTSFRQYLRC